MLYDDNIENSVTIFATGLIYTMIANEIMILYPNGEVTVLEANESETIFDVSEVCNQLSIVVADGTLDTHLLLMRNLVSKSITCFLLLPTVVLHSGYLDILNKLSNITILSPVPKSNVSSGTMWYSFCVSMKIVSFIIFIDKSMYDYKYSDDKLRDDDAVIDLMK
jgi:hypothetical protein